MAAVPPEIQPPTASYPPHQIFPIIWRLQSQLKLAVPVPSRIATVATRQLLGLFVYLPDSSHTAPCLSIWIRIGICIYICRGIAAHDEICIRKLCWPAIEIHKASMVPPSFAGAWLFLFEIICFNSSEKLFKLVIKRAAQTSFDGATDADTDRDIDWDTNTITNTGKRGNGNGAILFVFPSPHPYINTFCCSLLGWLGWEMKIDSNLNEKYWAK